MVFPLESDSEGYSFAETLRAWAPIKWTVVVASTLELEICDIA
jgi:hypothetical protein